MEILTRMTTPSNSNQIKIAVIITAAGSSTRMGGVNKILLPLGDRKVICVTMQAFQSCEALEVCPDVFRRFVLVRQACCISSVCVPDQERVSADDVPLAQSDHPRILDIFPWLIDERRAEDVVLRVDHHTGAVGVLSCFEVEEHRAVLVRERLIDVRDRRADRSECHSVWLPGGVVLVVL